MWDYEVTPPGVEVVERGDLLMWRRIEGPRAQARWGNRVAWIRTSKAHVDQVIDEIFLFFADIPFTWVIGASSRPAGLVDIAARRGLTDVGDGNLLTGELPIHGLRRSPDVRIEEVVDERLARIGITLAHPTSSDDEVRAMVADRLAYLGHPARRGGFLVAFVGDEPVANAGYRYSADGRSVYLNGAETVDRWRGQGIYQSLVAYRVSAAGRRGCRYVAIRARRDTSLPILMRRGFIDHGHLPIYSR